MRILWNAFAHLWNKIRLHQFFNISELFIRIWNSRYNNDISRLIPNDFFPYFKTVKEACFDFLFVNDTKLNIYLLRGLKLEGKWIWGIFTFPSGNLDYFENFSSLTAFGMKNFQNSLDYPRESKIPSYSLSLPHQSSKLVYK